MATEQKLSTKITIGAALDASFTRNVGLIKAGLDSVGSEIKTIETRQKELKKQRKVLEREGKSVDALDREYQELGSTLDKLRGSQKKWERAAAASNRVGEKFNQMQGAVGGLARNTTVAVGAAGAAIFSLANSTAGLGDHVAKTAGKMGIGIEALQELRYAAERSGMSAEGLDGSMEKLSKGIGEAVQGGGTAQKAFEQLGLSAQAMAAMQPDEALALVADRLQSVENGAERVALATAIFGRSGAGMINMLKDGSAGLTQLREDARATGYVLSEKTARDAEAFKDALLDAQLGLAGLKNTIGGALMPVVTDMMKDFTSYMRDSRDEVVAFAKRFADGFREIVPFIGDAVRGIAAIATGFASVTNNLASLVGGFDNLGIIMSAVFASKAVVSVLSFGSAVWGLGSAMIGLAGGLPAVAAGVKAIGLALVATPIGAIIAGIALAAGLVIANWSTVKAFFGTLCDWITDKFSAIGEFFTGLWAGITDAASAAFEWILEKLQWVGAGIGKVASFFGLGQDAGGKPGAEPTPSSSSAAPPAAIRGAAPGKADVTNNVTNAPVFNIQQQPGQDPRQLAEEIERIRRENERSALHDGAMAYGY